MPNRKFPHIIAHRGASSRAPENTIAAIKLALKANIYGVEFDVDLTKDGVPIVIHQETVVADFEKKRLKSQEGSSLQSWTSNYDWESLRELDAGSWFNPDFRDSRIPRLEEVFALDWRDHEAVMELKDSAYWNDPLDDSGAIRVFEQVRPLMSQFVSRGGRLSVLSFNPKTLELSKQFFPRIPRILAVWRSDEGKGAEVLERARIAHANAITFADSMILNDPSWMELARKVGAETYVYEVTPADPEKMHARRIGEMIPRWNRFYELGIAALGTDFPHDLRDVWYGDSVR